MQRGWYQMNDRYLYRAKRCDNGEWIVGFYHWTNWRNPQTKEIVEVTHSILPIDYQDSYHVDSSTICQCTGLKDKNGKLIWENDIVKDLFSDTYAPIRYGSYQNCFDSTKAEHIGFYVDWSEKYTKNYRKDLGCWIHMVDAEAIGNIFDNPELLKSEG